MCGFSKVKLSNIDCMPLVDDIIDQIGEAQYLSKKDLSKGFYQVLIAAANLDKTAFSTVPRT